MKVHLYTLILLPLLGCGTIQHVIPPVPLKEGQTEFRIGIGYSTSPISRLSFQMGGYTFLTDKDALGITFAGILPSSVSYAHYWPQTRGNYNAQIHYNDLLGCAFNPTFQAKLGASSVRDNMSHSATIGIGYYSTPFLHTLLGNEVVKGAFIPTASYQLRSNQVIFEIELLYGMTDYYIQYYKARYLQRPHRSELSISYPEIPSIITYSDVLEFEPLQGQDWISPGWIIRLRNNRSVFIASRDPYADCYGCGIDQTYRSSVTASANHNVYWLWLTNNDTSLPSGPIELRELDMSRVLLQYRNGADVILTEDPDLIERTRARIYPGLNDIFFSISKETWPRK